MVPSGEETVGEVSGSVGYSSIACPFQQYFQYKTVIHEVELHPRPSASLVKDIFVAVNQQYQFVFRNDWNRIKLSIHFAR
jgi:hypothetical protein